MEGDLAVIRGKVQAHQEESKAKRIRDRGGLWQPLSPSKNKLLGILNSAEFRNIAEARQPVVESHPQKQTKGKAKSTAKGRENKVFLDVGDDTEHSAKHKAKPNVVKRKGPKNSMGKSGNRGRIAFELDMKQATSDEIPSSTKKRKLLVSSENSMTKNEDRGKESQQKPASTVNKNGQAALSCQTRSKRVGRKRNLRDLASEWEGEVLDSQPPPPKKSRTSGAVNAIAEPRPKRQPKIKKLENCQSKTVGTDVERTSEYLAECKVKAANIPSHPDPANIFESSRKCGFKRLYSADMQSSCEEPPSPPKRKRTKGSTCLDSKPKATTQSSNLSLDTESVYSVETLEPSAREVSKCKASTSSKKGAKAKSRSRAISSDDAELSPYCCALSTRAKLGDRHLPTIIEDGEDLGESRKSDVLRDDGIFNSPPSNIITSQMVASDVSKPLQQHYGRSTCNNVDNLMEDSLFVKSFKTNIKAPARPYIGDIGNSVSVDPPKKTACAGMTKRRRKRVESTVGGIDVKGASRGMDIATQDTDSRCSHHEPSADTTKPKLVTRTKARHQSPVEDKSTIAKPSSSERLQNVLSTDESVVKAPSRTVRKRACSDSQLKTKADYESCSVKNRVTRPSKKRKQACMQAEQKVFQRQEGAVYEGKLPRHVDVRFGTDTENDLDELDLLS